MLAREAEFAGANEIDQMDTAHENPTNIIIMEILRSYPVPLKNHNKVILPASLLKEIHDKKVWDHRPKDKPLLFELSVCDPDTSDILEETIVGVDNFTAPPGKIGLPYKTALSLTKEMGVGWLNQNSLVSLRYVEVPSAPQTSIKVQPRGKGFFLEDESVVQLDIKTVLELTLKDHLVLTEGDWIPLFYDSNRFDLIVTEVQPTPIIDVLNTDLTVEILPSEDYEQGLREKDAAQQRVKDFVSKREQRYEEQMSRLASFKEAEKGNPDVVNIRVKLPKGGAVTKKYLKTDLFGIVLDTVDVELYKRKFTPMHLPPENLDYFFNIVYTLPGKGKTLIRTNNSGKLTIGEVLLKHEIKSKTVSLMLEMIRDNQNEGKGGDGEGRPKFISLNNEWLRMVERLETNLQENDDEPDLLPQNEIDDITANLEAVGCDKELSARVARLYGKQVNELINMGYQDQLPRAIGILNDKRGDISEVVEKLLE